MGGHVFPPLKCSRPPPFSHCLKFCSESCVRCEHSTDIQGSGGEPVACVPQWGVCIIETSKGFAITDPAHTDLAFSSAVRETDGELEVAAVTGMLGKTSGDDGVTTSHDLDIPGAVIYQLHRESRVWCYKQDFDRVLNVVLNLLYNGCEI